MCNCGSEEGITANCLGSCHTASTPSFFSPIFPVCLSLFLFCPDTEAKHAAAPIILQGAGAAADCALAPCRCFMSTGTKLYGVTFEASTLSFLISTCREKHVRCKDQLPPARASLELFSSLLRTVRSLFLHMLDRETPIRGPTLGNISDLYGCASFCPPKMHGGKAPNRYTSALRHRMSKDLDLNYIITYLTCCNTAQCL